MSAILVFVFKKCLRYVCYDHNHFINTKPNKSIDHCRSIKIDSEVDNLVSVFLFTHYSETANFLEGLYFSYLVYIDSLLQSPLTSPWVNMVVFVQYFPLLNFILILFLFVIISCRKNSKKKTQERCRI